MRLGCIFLATLILTTGNMAAAQVYIFFSVPPADAPELAPRGPWTAIPWSSNRAPKSSVPEPKNARGGNCLVK